MRITVQDPAYGPGAMCLYLNGHELDRVRQMAEGIAIRADGPEHVGLRRVLDGVLGAIDGFRTPPPVGLRYETRVFSGVVAPRTALAPDEDRPHAAGPGRAGAPPVPPAVRTEGHMTLPTKKGT